LTGDQERLFAGYSDDLIIDKASQLIQYGQRNGRMKYITILVLNDFKK
tara:strand:+ start:3027 stop:3170 length:144 start_codon:yes stop_codon:yes gene_type:complete